ncbi:sporulation protein YtxC, partial [Virgibacillus sp. W0430]|uniref:sporulation protein YtxC n=1 Tax=Virgibacillus sp. W0430 TaxID=3391580 RepID=UPI003F454685
LQEIADSMVHVFFVFRLSRMIKQVIQKYYFYTNIYEIERICEIAYGALSGEDKEAFKLIDRHKEMEPKSSLYSLFMTNIKSSKVIHFDSIIQFQLNSFKERLVYDVGLAIDEFKREEDHQAFIQMLREYVQKKKTIFKEIHVLQGNHFTFYQANGRQLTQNDLHSLMEREPLYIVGLDRNERNLAPLITIAPERIHIYGNNSSEPKTLTIINVFQERVRFHSVRQFPFFRIAGKE